MESVENKIKTSLLKRSIGLLIDVLFFYFGVLLFVFAIGTAFYRIASSTNQKFIVECAIILIVIGLFLMKDSINGISIGKWVMGTKVVREKNMEVAPKRGKLILRNLPLLILIIEIIVLFLSENRKRIGDNLANTLVIDNPNPASSKQRIIGFVLLILILIGTSFGFAFLMVQGI